MNTRVLVVEDDPILAEAHGEYVRRLAGFTLVGTVHHGAESVEIVSRGGVDLILLDFFLPDIDGLAVCRRLRARGCTTDVIAVTSERSLSAVQEAITLGVVQYLVKPFTFATFADRLGRYAEYRRMITDPAGVAAQGDVDRAFASLRTPIRHHLPKGLSEETLAALIGELREHDTAVTATEIADATGTSRVTARRYLEYLTAQRMVERALRYGSKGRPEHEYRWNRR
ncbi:transcriptional regulatory protein [Virgisporangium aliadipatigenens]|uniref:Transcriptional regulatory protein n=1 Tax=Virgisporangium aliadipatigenens TaxID=741659 RepID=A0A8J3YGQ0_9ACTN|nr:response regulator [Virgisporangium aliadipatigenens]GIJ43730.1 transcriptional regulatory protein [Virgisporangium aliadipatigenens]